jgi:membrane protein required for colicin V production
MGWVDGILLGILAISVVVGIVRGLVFELLSLVGWFAAWFAAQWLTPMVAPHIPVGRIGSGINHAAAFALTFVAALIVWGILARLLRFLIHVTPLSLIDRLLGGFFGLLRGVIVLLAIGLVVGMTPMVTSPAWTRSVGAPWLNATLAALKPVLPPQLSSHLPA